MKKLYFILAVALVTFAADSCSKSLDSNDIKPEGRTITATFDVEESYRTTISEGNTPLWAVGDVIKLYNASSSEEIELTSEMINDGGASCTFKTTLEGDDIAAVYPASAANGYTDGKIGIKIPSTTDGTFAKANICVAKLAGSNMSFKNATAVLKIKLGTGVQKVLFPFNSTDGKYIAGNFTIDPDNSWSATYVDGGNAVTLSPESPATETYYYVAAAPIKVQQGSVIVAKNDVKCVGSERISQANTLSRNKIYDLGTAEANGKVFTINKSGATVVFSGGNLRWNGKNFFFTDRQFAYTSSRTETEMTHFFWSSNVEEAVGNATTAPKFGDVLFCKNGGAIKGWTTLGYDEYKYMRDSTRSVTTTRFVRAKVGDYNALIFFPDSFVVPEGITLKNVNVSTSASSDNSFNEGEWNLLAKAGAVALPYNGFVRSSAPGTLEQKNQRADYWADQILNSDKETKNIYYIMSQDNSSGKKFADGKGDGTIARPIRLVVKF